MEFSKLLNKYLNNKQTKKTFKDKRKKKSPKSNCNLNLIVKHSTNNSEKVNKK